MYETIFVISWKLEGWFFLSLLIGIISFLWARIEYGRYRRGEKTSVSIFKYHSIIPSILCSMGFIVGFILSATYLTTYYQSNSAYKSGKYDIAEGKVFVLREQPREGRGEGDIIKISGTKLHIDPYSDYTNAGAYKKTIAFGGVLKDGVYAKVYHNKGKILRIDIKKEKPSKDSLSTIPPNQELTE